MSRNRKRSAQTMYDNLIPELKDKPGSTLETSETSETAIPSEAVGAVPDVSGADAAKDSDVSNSKLITQSASETPRPLAKHKNPDYFRTTVYLPKSLHPRLKVAAAVAGKDVSELISDVMEEWLDRQESVSL